MKKKSIVQTGSSILLSEQGLVIVAHKEKNNVNVFVIEKDEYLEQPNPYKANLVDKYTFDSEKMTIDDAFDKILGMYK